MSSTSLCSANLFLAPDSERQTAEVTKILGRFQPGSKKIAKNPNTRLDLEGYTYQEVKDGLVLPLAPFLDPDKRSTIMYRDASGRFHTIIVEGGKVVCA